MEREKDPDSYPGLFKWNESPDLDLGFKGMLGTLIVSDHEQKKQQKDKILLPCVSCPNTIPIASRMVNLVQRNAAKGKLIMCRTCKKIKDMEEIAQFVLSGRGGESEEYSKKE